MLTSFLTFHYAPIIYHGIMCSLLGVEYWLGKTDKVKAGSIYELLIIAATVSLNAILLKQKTEQKSEEKKP